MTFWISPYELKPRGLDSKLNAIASPGPRRGTLLRFDFGNGSFGYADCHPWPELGDLPWEEQVALLSQDRLTDLTQRSLSFAKLDAEARQKRISLWWEGAVIPPSHTLVPDLMALTPSQLEAWSRAGQTRVKFKVGKDPVAEGQVLAGFSDLFKKLGIQVRLDFNGQLTPAEFENFLKQIDLGVLDFVEDPCAYDGPLWADLQREFKIRLALDRVPSSLLPVFSAPDTSYSVLILKPAIQDPALMLEHARAQGAALVVTSYMDHPYGQLCAAWVAARLAREGCVLERCGLLTHLLYEPVVLPPSDVKTRLANTRQWENVFGSELQPPQEGFGFGLEFFLESQAWEVPNVG